MGEVGTRIRALSAKAELAVVVVAAFGLFIFASLTEFVGLLWSGGTGPPTTEAELIEMLAIQAIVLLVLGWFLWVRGWTLACLGLEPPGGVWHRRRSPRPDTSDTPSIRVGSSDREDPTCAVMRQASSCACATPLTASSG